MTETKVVTTVISSNEEHYRRVVVKKDFEQQHVVISCFVAGYRHNDGEMVIDVLEEGEKLHLVHEMFNVHDKNAVAVYTREYIQLGYVPRIVSEYVAKELDENKMVRCVLKRINRQDYHEPNVRLEMIIRIPM